MSTQTSLVLFEMQLPYDSIVDLFRYIQLLVLIIVVMIYASRWASSSTLASFIRQVCSR